MTELDLETRIELTIAGLAAISQQTVNIELRLLELERQLMIQEMRDKLEN